MYEIDLHVHVYMHIIYANSMKYSGKSAVFKHCRFTCACMYKYIHVVNTIISSKQMISTYIHVYVCGYVLFTHILFMSHYYGWMYTYMYVYIYTYIHIYIYGYIYIYTCICNCTYTYICLLYIYMFVNILLTLGMHTQRGLL